MYGGDDNESCPPKDVVMTLPGHTAKAGLCDLGHGLGWGEAWAV